MDRFEGKPARPSPFTTETPMEHSIRARRAGQARSADRFPAAQCRMVPGKKRVLTAAGVEAAQAPLSGHHQLTVGLLHSASN